jgi:hypothetical protein
MPMTVEQRERMAELCQRIQSEPEQAEFTALLGNLDALLEEAGYQPRSELTQTAPQ